MSSLVFLAENSKAKKKINNSGSFFMLYQSVLTIELI